MSEFRTRFLVTRVVGTLVVAAIVLVSRPASAQDNEREQAKQHFRAGQQAFDAGQYLGAARAFEESYKILPIPDIAFSMAQAYRLHYFVDKEKRVQWLNRALEMYNVYVAKKPKGNRLGDAVTHIAEINNILRTVQPDGNASVAKMPEPTTQVMITTQAKGAKGTFNGKTDDLPLILDLEPGDYEVEITADGYFAEKRPFKAFKGRFVTVEVALQPRPAQVRVITVDKAEVMVDGRPQGETPLVRPLELDQGAHFVAVTKRGHRPWAKEIDLSNGQELVLKPEMRITTRRKISYGFGAVGALGAVATTVAAVATGTANARAFEIKEQHANGSITRAQFDDYVIFRDQRNTRFGITMGLSVITGLALLTGGVLYFFDTPRVTAPPDKPRRKVVDETPSMLSITPTAGPSTAGLSMQGRF